MSHIKERNVSLYLIGCFLRPSHLKLKGLEGLKSSTAYDDRRHEKWMSHSICALYRVSDMYRVLIQLQSARIREHGTDPLSIFT